MAVQINNIQKIDFTGGMNTAQVPQLVQENQCALLLNVDMDYRHLRGLKNIKEVKFDVDPPIDSAQFNYDSPLPVSLAYSLNIYPYIATDGKAYMLRSSDGVFVERAGRVYTSFRGYIVKYDLEAIKGNGVVAPRRIDLPRDDDVLSKTWKNSTRDHDMQLCRRVYVQ